MKTTILMDNEAQDDLGCEWGFSALIETDDGASILLDTGASGLFAQNAHALGIDLAQVDYAVLSHAHFDHADGFETFFDANDHAPLLLQDACEENCYSDAKGPMTYIGIKPGLMGRHADRIRRLEAGEVVQFAPGCWLVPHSTPGLDDIGARENLYLQHADIMFADGFYHEQSLVIETRRGLVVYSSCSHGGVENIINEVRAAFDGRPIIALVGGLHLFLRSSDEVRALAARIRDLGLEKVYTGHCTGDEALAVLQEELGSMVEPTRAGLAFEL